eukprot:8908070-Pyramimonas_sp.AAC.1
MYLHFTALLQKGATAEANADPAQMRAEEPAVIHPGDGLKELSSPVRPFAEVWPKRNRLVGVNPS